MPANELALPPILTLPQPLLLRILMALPVDARMRCAEVCRLWRDVLREPRMWTRLDMSNATGGLARRATASLIRAAIVQAAGQLRALVVDYFDERLASATLEFNPALAELRAVGERAYEFDGLSFRGLEWMLRPPMRVLQSAAKVQTPAQALLLLRKQDVYAPLCLTGLKVGPQELQMIAAFPTEDLYELAREFAATEQPVSKLAFENVQLNAPGVLDAFVDAALARRVTFVELLLCVLHPVQAPDALVRLVRGGSLSALTVTSDELELDVHGASALGSAVCESGTLCSLTLCGARLFPNAMAAAALINCLVAHPSLRELDLDSPWMEDDDERRCMGAALFSLVASNSPSLESFSFEHSRWGDAPPVSLCEALRRNTHLRYLFLDDNDLREAFVRDSLLPAVRANTSLRVLTLGLDYNAAREAEALVAARRGL